MAFDAVSTEIRDLIFIRPLFAEDQRGYYKKSFEREAFERLGVPTQYFESSDIYSRRGAIRGLHYQEKHSQGKLLHVIKGCIYDVALDLRPQSDTFGRWYGTELNEDTKMSLFIPPSFAHGFMALEDSVFSYQSTNYYEPDSCGGILWNDPELGIPWPIHDDVIITEKDKGWPTFAEYCRLKGIERLKNGNVQRGET